MTPTDYANSCVKPASNRPSREEAERAVHTLLRWAGDDPEREGLKTRQHVWSTRSKIGFQAMTRIRKITLSALSKKWRAMTIWLS